jgi:hypothetical protein
VQVPERPPPDDRDEDDEDSGDAASVKDALAKGDALFRRVSVLKGGVGKGELAFVARFVGKVGDDADEDDGDTVAEEGGEKGRCKSRKNGRERVRWRVKGKGKNTVMSLQSTRAGQRKALRDSHPVCTGGKVGSRRSASGQTTRSGHEWGVVCCGRPRTTP